MFSDEILDFGKIDDSMGHVKTIVKKKLSSVIIL